LKNDPPRKAKTITINPALSFPGLFPFCRSLVLSLVSFVIVFRTERGALDIGTIWSSHTSRLFATVLILFHQEFHNFTIGKGTESVGLNGSLMDKNVLSAIIRDKKPESLDGVEPFEKEWGGRGDGNECVLCMCVSVSETTKRVVVVRRRDAGREGKKNNSFPVADSSPNALYKYVPFDSTLFHFPRRHEQCGRGKRWTCCTRDKGSNGAKKHKKTQDNSHHGVLFSVFSSLKVWL
jgi:hypothetical protein